MPFSPIVLFGERTPLPHGMPSNRTLQHSDPILIDFGTSVNGYMSDITRCFFFGEPDAKAREVYEVVLAANTAGREAAGPGVPAQDVDRAARQVIEEAGYGEYFIHRTGHGLGIDAHEEPYIVEGNSQHLEPGMCFTVEPGIYIPGEIGIRIEDDLIITGEGAESLSTFPREIRVLNGA
ncbi:MAG: M24 family metallopeptidase [Anaerolineae bacterium]